MSNTEALKIARDALADMIRAGKQAKVDLTTGIRDGEPVHPVSASLTFPLATAINAIAAIDALAQQASVPSAEPVYWQWRRKGDPWSLGKTFNSQVYATTNDSEVRPLYAAPTPLPATTPEAQAAATASVAGLVAMELERIAQDPPVSGNVLTQTRVLMAAANVREFGLAGGTTPQAAPVAPEPIAVEAVAEIVDTADGLELRWLIEGGIAALVEGCVLVMPTRPITDDFGHGEVYMAPTAPAAPAPTAQPSEKE